MEKQSVESSYIIQYQQFFIENGLKTNIDKTKSIYESSRLPWDQENLVVKHFYKDRERFNVWVKLPKEIYDTLAEDQGPNFPLLTLHAQIGIDEKSGEFTFATVYEHGVVPCDKKLFIDSLKAIEEKEFVYPTV